MVCSNANFPPDVLIKTKKLYTCGVRLAVHNRNQDQAYKHAQYLPLHICEIKTNLFVNRTIINPTGGLDIIFQDMH